MPKAYAFDTGPDRGQSAFRPQMNCTRVCLELTPPLQRGLGLLAWSTHTFAFVFKQTLQYRCEKAFRLLVVVGAYDWYMVERTFNISLGNVSPSI